MRRRRHLDTVYQHETLQLDEAFSSSMTAAFSPARVAWSVLRTCVWLLNGSLTAQYHFRCTFSLLIHSRSLRTCQDGEDVHAKMERMYSSLPLQSDLCSFGSQRFQSNQHSRADSVCGNEQRATILIRAFDEYVKIRTDLSASEAIERSSVVLCINTSNDGWLQERLDEIRHVTPHRLNAVTCVSSQDVA